MKLIVSLGNPGKKYENNRHNLGFQVLDFVAKQNSTNFSENKKFKSESAEIGSGRAKVLLLKPATFMNSSGEAVQAAKKYYGDFAALNFPS